MKEVNNVFENKNERKENIMINKELIELQKGCNATCVVIQNEDIKELESKILVDSTCNTNDLIKIFKENISNEKYAYLVIEEIDKINLNEQNKYYQIVKDREFLGYKLPEDIIIVLTVKSKETLKNISQNLYNLCVVAF